MKKYFLVEVWKKDYFGDGVSRKISLVAVRPSKLTKFINRYPSGFEFRVVGVEYYKFDSNGEE